MGVCSCKSQKKVGPSSSSNFSINGETFVLACGPPPLDKRQIFRLKQSWKQIRRHLKETAIEMFARLFRNNADLRLFITKSSGITEEDEVRNSEIILNTAFWVMQNIDDYITNIDDHNYISDLITHTRLYYLRLEGYSHRFFWKFKEPFLDAVKITLGDSLSDSLADIYVITIDYLLGSLSGGKKEDDTSLCQEEMEKEIEAFKKYKGASYPSHNNP